LEFRLEDLYHVWLPELTFMVAAASAAFVLHLRLLKGGVGGLWGGTVLAFLLRLLGKVGLSRARGPVEFFLATLYLLLLLFLLLPPLLTLHEHAHAALLLCHSFSG